MYDLHLGCIQYDPRQMICPFVVSHGFLSPYNHMPGNALKLIRAASSLNPLASPFLHIPNSSNSMAKTPADKPTD
jgi:hypothetical protein